MNLRVAIAIGIVAAVAAPWKAEAQGRGGASSAPAADQTPRAAAPIDLTGYWVSVVTEDWRYRMVTPAKGDYQGVPMTPEAVKVADAWDPAADEAAGNQCRAYGAAALLRLPGRLHITWQDDDTLRVDADAGTQTRLFDFRAGASRQPSEAPHTWQGVSAAQWQTPARGRGAAPSAARTGSLEVTTTRMRAGYLRKNGVPYSDDAVLTEYFDLAPMPDGGLLLVVTSRVEDPRYLRQPFIVSSQFKKQADASGWDPTPCSATW